MFRETDQPDRAAGLAPVLILGLGNILLRDEGLGVRVVEHLLQSPLPLHIEACDGATAGFDLVDLIAKRETVAVIDAISADLPPGTVVRLSPEELESPGFTAVSLHEMGFVEALIVARRMGIAPKRVVIYGVEPQQVEWGLELSDTIRRVIPQVAEQVLSDLQPALESSGAQT